MPTSIVFYINGPSLASSTAIYDDAEMTICSADGFYSDGFITRQQVGCKLLPAQACPNCNIYELSSSTTATTTSSASCESAIDTTYYYIPADGVADTLEVGDAVFFDILGESPLYDGWYLTDSGNPSCPLAYRMEFGLVAEFVNCCAVSASLCYSTLSAIDASCGCLG